MIEYLAITDGSIAVIDAKHFDRISKFVWTNSGTAIQRHFNARVNYKWHTHSISLAQAIMQNCYSMFDHIDRNYLNNTEINLRPATYSQNSHNRIYDKSSCTSRYRGVFKKANGKFKAQVTKNSKCLNLGTFLHEDEAALVYNSKAIELYGEFAVLNQIK